MLLWATAPAIAQQPSEPAPSVLVAPVRLVDFVDRVEALGTTRANEAVAITANVTEKIVEIRFDDGQAVERGDILVLLESAEEEAERAAAEAALAEQELAYARVEELESRNIAAAAQLDERRAALQAAKAEVAVIGSRIADRIIRAPFSGVVGMRTISVGALIEPGDLITTLEDQSVIKVDFAVPATYLAALRPGLPVRATAASLDDLEFHGTVKSIDSHVDPVTRSIVARAVLPNPDGKLRPGLLLHIELTTNARRSLALPEEALISRGRRDFAWVVDEDDGNRVLEREVETGARVPGLVEIVHGLEEGEQVITHGVQEVRPGEQVRVKAVQNVNEPLETLLKPAE